MKKSLIVVGNRYVVRLNDADCSALLLSIETDEQGRTVYVLQDEVSGDTFTLRSANEFKRILPSVETAVESESPPIGSAEYHEQCAELFAPSNPENTDGAAPADVLPTAPTAEGETAPEGTGEDASADEPYSAPSFDVPPADAVPTPVVSGPPALTPPSAPVPVDLLAGAQAMCRQIEENQARNVEPAPVEPIVEAPASETATDSLYFVTVRKADGKRVYRVEARDETDAVTLSAIVGQGAEKISAVRADTLDENIREMIENGAEDMPAPAEVLRAFADAVAKGDVARAFTLMSAVGGSGRGKASKPAGQRAVRAPREPKQKPAPKVREKKVLRDPQVRVLRFLASNSGYFSRKQIAVGAETDVPFLTTWLGAEDDAQREANARKRGIPSLLCFGLIEFARVDSFGRDVVVYRITSAGRRVVEALDGAGEMPTLRPDWAAEGEVIGGAE